MIQSNQDDSINSLRIQATRKKQNNLILIFQA